MKSYWNGNGKFQEIANDVSTSIPYSGNCDSFELELVRIVLNAYYDYYNNGGCNRAHRLAELCNITFKRGTPASAALSKLRRYNNGSCNYMPKGLEDLYEVIMDQVLSDYKEEMEGKQ